MARSKNFRQSQKDKKHNPTEPLISNQQKLLMAALKRL